jgi:uncharacterized OsmC-like protein
MKMAINNMNLKEMMAFIEEVKLDLSKSEKSKKIKCSWNFNEGKPQMESKVQYPRGETLLQSDFVPLMRGSGLVRDPTQYCLFGFAACFAGTFMSIATMMGINIQSLKVSVENFMDLSKTLGLPGNPIVDRVRITTTVRSEAKEERLKELGRLARERCPGVYCLVNPIPLESELIHGR